MPKNIVLLCMTMNIGGAETHIYELALGLKSLGHNVTIISSGGILEEKLSKNDINHIYAPLNSRKLCNLLKSYKIVKKFVKAHRDCIIHSHTRISNFIANFICKRYRIPFITTVHGRFSLGYWEKKFSRWGTHSLAVSQDLKNYLVENYNYNPDNVTITVNGINLNTFSKRRNFQFKASLNIKENSKVILCVSRIDVASTIHINKVLDMADEIYKQCPDTNIVIVGGGNAFEKMQERVKEINKRTCDNFIQMVGPSTEVYNFYNIANVFVGISRSALEAMACKVPVVLLGDFGYIGVFSDKTQKACIDTNFTCRDCEFPSDKVICDQIIDVLKNPQNYEQSVLDAYELIKNNYSINRMVADALKSYQKVENLIRPTDIMLSGYYGRSNLGDDLALNALMTNIKNTCDIEKTVVLTSKRNEHDSDDMIYVHRFNIFKIYHHMKRTKLFMLGGGSLLQDVTSSRSLLYYLFVLNLAIRCRCKTMLYGNGVGPIIKKHHRNMTRRALNKTTYISLRDRNSMKFLRFIGVENRNMLVTADETFTLSSSMFSKKSSIANIEIPKDKELICINIRGSHKNSNFLEKFAKFIDCISEKYNFMPVLLPVHYNQDPAALDELSKCLNCQHILATIQLSHPQTLELIRMSRFSVCERLHALIFSSIFNKPFMAIDYDPKVHDFAKRMNLDKYMQSSTNFDVEKALRDFDLLVQDEQEIKVALDKEITVLKGGAMQNAEIAKKLLDKIPIED